MSTFRKAVLRDGWPVARCTQFAPNTPFAVIQQTTVNSLSNTIGGMATEVSQDISTSITSITTATNKDVGSKSPGAVR